MKTDRTRRAAALFSVFLVTLTIVERTAGHTLPAAGRPGAPTVVAAAH